MTQRFGPSAADFARGLRRFGDLMIERETRLYRAAVDHVERSIKDGSAVTGAPGQPIQSGNLYRAWHRAGSLGAQNVAIVCDVIMAPYAGKIEHRTGGITIRSSVGGAHSIKITRLNFPLIIRHELPIVKKATR